MAKTYTLNVAGLTRELTICKVNDHMDIAAFIMLGDAELTVAAAAELLKKCPDFDILLTAVSVFDAWSAYYTYSGLWISFLCP